MTADIDVIVDTELPDGANAESLRAIALEVLRVEEKTGDWTVAIVLTGDDALRRLHAQFMNDDSVTDVMTFPADLLEGHHGGDVVISVQRAIEQSGEWNMSPWEEVRFLAVHGLLHLCGWRDDTGELRDAMLERQAVILEQFDLRTMI